LLGVRSPGEGFFAVHPKTWRAAILVLMHDSFGGCTPAGIIAELDRRGWLVGMLRGHRCGEEEAADANLPDGGAEGAVQRFLRALAKRGIAEDHGWKWTYTQNHRDRIATRRMTRERLEREAAARAARLACLRTLARTAVDATSSHERSQFDIELWCSFATEAAPQSPLRIAEDGGAEWNVLERGLILAAAVLKDEKEEQAADFGLPISQSLAAMREIHLARAEQRKSEAEAAALRDRNARIDALVRSSAEALGDDHRDWLDGPDPMLKATPRDAAAESAERLSAARQQLAVHVARKRIKERWLDELKRSAAILLRRPDWLAPYLDSPDPKLPGRVSPRVHTTDQASMMECLALLKQRSGR
jgi:hypothetical protein